MEKSESIKNIAAALITFQIKVSKVNKDATNPFFKSKYASLSNIQDAIATPLEESGISYMQFPDGQHGLTTIIMHESGEWLQSTYTMKPVKDDPQGIGSSITYQKRYALAGALALNIDDDDDANTATHGGKTPEKAVDNNRREAETLQRNLNSILSKIAQAETVEALTEIKQDAIKKGVGEVKEFKVSAMARFKELTLVTA